jgi:hypothetical protein
MYTSFGFKGENGYVKWNFSLQKQEDRFPAVVEARFTTTG